MVQKLTNTNCTETYNLAEPHWEAGYAYPNLDWGPKQDTKQLEGFKYCGAYWKQKFG